MTKRIQTPLVRLTFLLLTLWSNAGFLTKAWSQTTLTAGDVTIIGYDTSNPDAIGLVLLTDITAGTSFSVTDNGWLNTGAFRTGEGVIGYSAPTNLPAGTVLTWENSATAVVSQGFSSTAPAGFSLNSTGESLIVFTGSLAAPNLIYALSSGTWSTNATSASTSAEPIAANGGTLVSGVTTVQLTTNGGTNGYYSGTGTGTKNELLASLANTANWTTASARLANTNWKSNFTVQTVPLQPDLTAALSGPVTATLNQSFNYSLVVSNAGSASASGITVQVTLPASTSATYNSATGASGFIASRADDVVLFSAGTLTAGASATLTVCLTPTVTGTLTSGTAVVDPANSISESNETNNAAQAVTVTVGAAGAGQMRITEFAYDGVGSGGEFIELTNVGTAAVDMTGWSFDDNSQLPGSFAIGEFGLVQPGESVLIAENAAEAFRLAWFLPATVKVIGGNNQNLGRADEINIYDASNTLVDRLSYGDNTLGGPRTQNRSAWTIPANLGTNTITAWQLSAVNDAQHSYASVPGNIGNPGGYNVPLNRIIVRESGNSTTVTEGGMSDTYTIALNSQPTADVIVSIAPGSQLTTNPATLTFTPSNFSVVQIVSVSAVDDAEVEGVHSATLTHSSTSADAAYTGITINPVSVTITDNDVAAGSSPTIVVASTTTAYLSASTVSSVIGDPTDPASTLGIDFTIDDTDTPAESLSVTASSTNASVAPVASLTLTGSGASRNLRITPAGVGYTILTVMVSDGSSTASFVISYAASAAATMTSRFHTGASDASTAVDAGEGYMLVADDENQVLRLYKRTNSGLPFAGFDYTSSLGLTDLSGGVPREVDIEASVRVGDRIYWLGSHSNSSGGANRPNRSRLFATDVTGIGASTTLRYVGRYDGLKTDLISWDINNGHGLGTSYFGLQASAATGVAPETDGGVGFNIEGLTMAPDGTTGYLSFRAPISPASNRTQALIVPVTNFTSLVSGNPTGGPATFGAPILLDLGGRGIREIKGNGTGQYVIVAGPSGGAGGDPNASKLYTWTGNPTDRPVLRATDLSGLSGTSGASSIESIVDLPASLNATSSIQFVMDNGDQVYYNDGTIAKELSQNNFKKSRSDYATLGEAILSDLTSVLYARPTSAYATTPVSLVVDVMELNGVPTNGVITLYVTKDPLVNLSLDMTATTVDRRAVQNSRWTFDGNTNPDYYVLTTTQQLTGGAMVSVGLTGTLSPAATEGRLSLSAVLVGSSGGEVKVTNNADADKIDYFDK